MKMLTQKIKGRKKIQKKFLEIEGRIKLDESLPLKIKNTNIGQNKKRDYKTRRKIEIRK